MALYDNRSQALERGSKQHPREIFASFTARVRSVMGVGGDGDAPSGGRSPAEWGGNDAETVEGQLVLRFPVVRRGYDRDAVDAYVADLERELGALDHELAQLRGQGAPTREVESEIKRIGEQTSAVLMAAHEQREEILSAARSEAERCVADATATARSLTEQSEGRLRALEAQNAAARGERGRLLADIRRISTALAEVADSADGGARAFPGA